MTTDIQKIIRKCITDGLRVRRNRGGHYIVYLPNRKVVTVSATSCVYSTIKKIKADFKRNGYEINNN